MPVQDFIKSAAERGYNLALNIGKKQLGYMAQRVIVIRWTHCELARYCPKL